MEQSQKKRFSNMVFMENPEDPDGVLVMFTNEKPAKNPEAKTERAKGAG